jgi:hypothetical protein
MSIADEEHDVGNDGIYLLRSLEGMQLQYYNSFCARVGFVFNGARRRQQGRTDMYLLPSCTFLLYLILLSWPGRGSRVVEEGMGDR